MEFRRNIAVFIKEEFMKNKYSLALLVAGTLAIPSVMASDHNVSSYNGAMGSVTFIGDVLPNSCRIAGDKNRTIYLDPVNANTINILRPVKNKSFEIRLTDCTHKGGLTPIVKWEKPSNVTLTGNIGNQLHTNNAAQNVALSLRDLSNKKVNFLNLSENSREYNHPGQGNNSYKFTVGYIKDKPFQEVLPGKFQAQVQYRLSYE